MSAPVVAEEVRWRRVIHSGDPRSTDHLAAREWIQDIRSRLSHIRGELEDIGRLEATFPHDRMCDKVAGSLTLALIALYPLAEGERSFAARAERSDELWAEIAADPDAFIVKDGASWDWRPRRIFKRPSGPAVRPPGNPE